jgi:hypothetical protein
MINGGIYNVVHALCGVIQILPINDLREAGSNIVMKAIRYDDFLVYYAGGWQNNTD